MMVVRKNVCVGVVTWCVLKAVVYVLSEHFNEFVSVRAMLGTSSTVPS